MKLILGDCLEVMNDIPSNSVDMILTDPPYGRVSCKWDVVVPFKPMWNQLNRLTKPNGAIILFGNQPFSSLLITSNIKMFKQELIWLKTRPTNVFNAKKMFMNWHENILIFYKKLPTFNPQMRTDGQFSGKKIQRNNHNRGNGIFGKTGEKKDYVHESNGGLFYPKTSIEISNVNKHKNVHPTQKPVLLLEYLIKTYTSENELILDFTMGSGSTGVACVNTNRNFIGIEKDKEYYEIAKNRIEDQQAKQMDLPFWG